jgi:uncharacterized phage protein (predicted DNA packaging)
MATPQELLPKLKKNLILDHSDDDDLLLDRLAQAIAYAESYQHVGDGFYGSNAMPKTTELAVLMMASDWYESRDGSTSGFWGDSTVGAANSREVANGLLRLDRRWGV